MDIPSCYCKSNTAMFFSITSSQKQLYSQTRPLEIDGPEDTDDDQRLVETESWQHLFLDRI